nr:PhoH family protein [bacterium]
MEKLTINFEKPSEAVAICPQGSPNVALLEEACGVKVVVRDNFIRLWGPASAVAKADRIIREAREALPGNGAVLPAGELERLIELAGNGGSVPRTRIRVATSRGYVRPRTVHQEEYVKAIGAHEIVFSIGPAGTGKTYLAVAMAVSALLEGAVRRLILTRP